MNEKLFGGRVRIRVCGILEQNDKVLLVHLKSPARPNPVWMPPGGGLEFGESIETALKREFFEETGIEVGITRFLFLREFVQPPWHAVELYYEVHQTGGNLKKGIDPELEQQNQIILDVKWISRSRFLDLDVIPNGL